MKGKKEGLNWTFYTASTRAEAEEYFIEITGNAPKYHWVIWEDNGEFIFRIHK